MTKNYTHNRETYATSRFGTTIRPLNYNTPLDLTLQMRRRNNINIHQQADSTDINAIITDMDHFPYKRWFVSEVKDDYTTVDDREAGWRVRRDFLYKNTDHIYDQYDMYPNLVFQTPCNTFIPKYQDPAQVRIKNLQIVFPP